MRGALVLFALGFFTVILPWAGPVTVPNGPGST
jgi:hypothetical protein